MTINFDGKHTLQIANRAAFSVVKASGENILTYIQGQVTQDVKNMNKDQAVYSVILNQQAKSVTEFYMLQGLQNEVIMLCPSEQAILLVERLKRFMLGYELRIGVVSPWQILSIQGEGVDSFLQKNELPVPENHKLAVQHQDETYVLRMPEIGDDGVWLIGGNIGIKANEDEAMIEKGRTLKGIPKFGVDWDGKIHPLNANLIERGGVNFDKGCYVGQEVTSRMHWRGGIKKKLYRVQVDGVVEQLPVPVFTTVKVGMLSSLATDIEGKQFGIALLPIEVVEKSQSLSLEAGQRVTVEGICQ